VPINSTTPAIIASRRARRDASDSAPGLLLPKSARKTTCHANSVPNRTLAPM
jgi:hypothetical protein